MGMQRNSVPWALTHDDWSDLTIEQIAEVLSVSERTVANAIANLKKKGIVIEYVRERGGRPKREDIAD